MPKGDNTLNSFISLTKCDKKIAKKYLNRNSWNINYALNDYYDQEFGGFVGGIKDNTPLIHPEELVKLFEKYATKEQDVIEGEGLIRFIGDLDYQLEDLVTICLANLLQCSNLADGITREQFLTKWTSQECTQISQMRKVLDELSRKLELDINYMSEIYNYTFNLVLDTDKRTLDVDAAIEYWRIFFQPKYPIHVDPSLLSSWIEFLKEENKTVITKDTWQMLLEFFKRFPNKTAVKVNYNEADAWPYIIDEYYDYLQERGLI